MGIVWGYISHYFQISPLIYSKKPDPLTFPGREDPQRRPPNTPETVATPRGRHNILARKAGERVGQTVVLLVLQKLCVTVHTNSSSLPVLTYVYNNGKTNKVIQGRGYAPSYDDCCVQLSHLLFLALRCFLFFCYGGINNQVWWDVKRNE